LTGKLSWDLATLMFQVLLTYPGKEVKKGLTDLCRRLILVWQKIVLGLGSSDVQVLTGEGGEEGAD
jgi:hypothetical protein